MQCLAAEIVLASGGEACQDLKTFLSAVEKDGRSKSERHRDRDRAREREKEQTEVRAV